MNEGRETESQPKSIRQLMDVWQEAWVKPQPGPLFSANLYRSPNYELMDERSHQANEPEREAYRQLVNFAASEIASRAKLGDIHSAVDDLVRAVPHFANKTDTAALFRDVFVGALGLMTTPEGEQPVPGYDTRSNP